MAVQISKKRKFVADGIFKAELNEFLTRELAEDGYSGVEVRVTPTRTEIIILATRTQNVLGEKGRRIRELTAVVQKRFGFPEGSVERLVGIPDPHLHVQPNHAVASCLGDHH
uniref:KH type-2 domain-containing protein n=1 Tax=Rhinopithecus roxellana TaxID=61622 RepID=A0A2K6QV28_RHIRO